LKKRGLVDDVDIYFPDSSIGPAIRFANQDIRKMLKLARAREGDVLLDLGCGWGQNLIIALTEFNVSKAIGYENDRRRYEKAIARKKRWSKARPDISSDRWVIVHEDFDEILDGKSRRASLKEATIIFYGLVTYPELVESIDRGWKDLSGDRRLVYYRNCLFPEILPDRSDIPFYLSNYPFHRTTDSLEWLRRIVQKENSSLDPGAPIEEAELWDELRHDYRVEADFTDVKEYQRRLSKILKRKTC
jgi:hypothetical protein